MTYQAIYYRDAEGNEPANAFIDTLDPVCQSEVDWRIGLLNGLTDANPELPFPHSSAIKGKAYRGLRELRAPCGRTHYRVIFQRSGRFFVLLHAFEKRGREIPERVKEVALERWLDFQDANGRHSSWRPSGDRARCALSLPRVLTHLAYLLTCAA